MPVYVYGVMRADARPRLQVRGVEGQAARRLAHGDLAALVGEAGEGEVRASRRNLMGHTAVLKEVVAASCDVLPMRFGTVLPDEDAVREELLGAHAGPLAAELDTLAGLVELDITVSCPSDDLVRLLVQGDTALADAARRLRDGSYGDRIELGERIAGAVAGARERITGRVLDALADVAGAADAGEPAHEDMVANVAVLVAWPKLAAFDDAIERLAAELGEPLRVRCVGPLPPYRFAEVPLGREGAWA
jgi:gas vesicle protein GvpL/GvpF